ncbi:MAG: hypothetical protein A2Z72_00055 [Omnitrophica bacterium RBG_13_46_9]|nr:MAG: hypothetical protein A2Z72_00055 [Omnitrophica bacterium RBG_13_46_9]
MLTKNDPAVILTYLEDSSNLKGGHADKVLIPQNIEEVSSVLKEANSKKISVTISGAGTGQAGGRIPFGGLVLSTEKLSLIKQTRKLDKGGCVTAEAGVPIKDLKEECDRNKLFYTYDPTEQTAFVGGTVATNASGARSFRYGPTRRYVKGMKLVLADGSILSLNRGEIKAKGRVIEFRAEKRSYRFDLPKYKMPLTKNSAGYFAEDDMDLVDLFVGQEGTLGVIAEAEFRLPEKPKGLFSCFAFFADEVSSWDFAQHARKAGPLSIEYFDNNCLGLLREKYPNVPVGARAAIFFEDEIVESENTVIGKWGALLSKKGVLLDNTWVAMNEKARGDFLEKRRYIPERMSEMAKRSGLPKVSTDLAVPDNKASEMMLFYKDNLKNSALQHFVFGHIGDSHLHVNMLPADPGAYEKSRKLQLEFVKKSIALGGTVSAEHGIGKTKTGFLKLLYGENGVKDMFTVKKALDPNLILGRGNIFAV